MKQKVILFIILSMMFVSYLFADYSQSYDTPQDALFAASSDDNPLFTVKRLIPVRQIDDEAIFFFLNGKESISAAFLNEGIFGWKSGVMTSSDTKLDSIKPSQLIPEVAGASGKVLYGITNSPEVDSIRVNGEPATVLPLQFALHEEKYRDYKIWWFISDNIGEDPTVEAYDLSGNLIWN